MNRSFIYFFLCCVCLIFFFTFKNIHSARIGNVKQIGRRQILVSWGVHQEFSDYCSGGQSGCLQFPWGYWGWKPHAYACVWETKRSPTEHPLSCPWIFLQNAFSVAFSSLSGRTHAQQLVASLPEKPLKWGSVWHGIKPGDPEYGDDFLETTSNVWSVKGRINE